MLIDFVRKVFYRADKQRRVGLCVNDHVEERSVEINIVFLLNGSCTIENLRGHSRRSRALLCNCNRRFVKHLTDERTRGVLVGEHTLEVGVTSECVIYTENLEIIAQLVAVKNAELWQMSVNNSAVGRHIISIFVNLSPVSELT